ncbi:hypothetical protein BD626DRAFT_471809 [Schizophyllum amplum]|uniref:Uncharacterized protein n=1 Tax=Schizophyllum amplum TaxID=97359 RepID=A0A550CVF7_9AGAR|nr:hypothetical protein BD626DRAFT_471809 [Auriculariopsis ampla]
MAPTLLKRAGDVVKRAADDKTAQAATIAVIVIVVVLIVATGVGLIVTREKRRLRARAHEFTKAQEGGAHYVRRSYETSPGGLLRPVSTHPSTRPTTPQTYAQVPLGEHDYEEPWDGRAARQDINVSEHDYTAVPLMHAAQVPSYPSQIASYPSSVTLVSQSPTPKRESPIPNLPPLHIPVPQRAASRPLKLDRDSDPEDPEDIRNPEDTPDIPTPSSSPSIYSQPSLHSSSIRHHHRQASSPPPPVPMIPQQHRTAAYFPPEPSPLERGNTKRVSQLLQGRARARDDITSRRGDDPSRMDQRRTDTMVSHIEREDSIDVPSSPPSATVARPGPRFASGRPLNVDVARMSVVPETPDSAVGSPRWSPDTNSYERHDGRGTLTNAFDNALSSGTTSRAPSSSANGVSRGTSIQVAPSFQPYMEARSAPVKDRTTPTQKHFKDASGEERRAEKRISARMDSVRGIIGE